MAENKGRILGIDAGTVRTGLALSDERQYLASALCTVKANGIRSLAAEIKAKADEYKVVGIVMGHPINMNGTLGESSQRVHRLKEEIEKICEIPVELFDERCSTMVATNYLNMTNVRGQKRKAVIDNLSAEIILQDYLDKKNR